MKKPAKSKLKLNQKAKPTSRRKHFDSHWGIFGLQGIVALAAGAYLLFTNSDNSALLINITGAVLIILGIIEIFNILHRHHHRHSWGLQLIISLVELAIGVTVIISDNHYVHIALLAGYALVDGITAMIVGFKGFADSTSRFFWVACGMASSVIAFVIFADQNLSETTFIKLFGIFLMVLGLTSVFYAMHSRDGRQQLKSGK